jgi:hypothetical protein
MGDISLSSMVGILGLEMVILEYGWGPPPDHTQVLVTWVTELAEKAQVLVCLDDWLAWDVLYGHDSLPSLTVKSFYTSSMQTQKILEVDRFSLSRALGHGTSRKCELS